MKSEKERKVKVNGRRGNERREKKEQLGGKVRGERKL